MLLSCGKLGTANSFSVSLGHHEMSYSVRTVCCPNNNTMKVCPLHEPSRFIGLLCGMQAKCKNRGASRDVVEWNLQCNLQLHLKVVQSSCYKSAKSCGNHCGILGKKIFLRNLQREFPKNKLFKNFYVASDRETSESRILWEIPELVSLVSDSSSQNVWLCNERISLVSHRDSLDLLSKTNTVSLTLENF